MIIKVPYFENQWGGDSLKDQLSYAITDANFEVVLAVVDKEDMNDASIIRVNNASADVNKELAC